MKFHERFDIEVGLVEAKRRFVNRVHNLLIDDFVFGLRHDTWRQVYKAITSKLGERYADNKSIHQTIGLDFFRNLQAVEAIYEFLGPSYSYSNQEERRLIDLTIHRLLSESEADLGIAWQDGHFVRKGAALLDQKLVNDTLHWLRDAGYESVLQPFEKGLRHFVEANVKKHVLSDVITDMYEALEALAKIVTSRDKDLSANQESFISRVKASENYKALLKNYINYANDFRHAASENKPKPQISEQETESFVYMTGVFIRLAMLHDTLGS